MAEIDTLSCADIEYGNLVVDIHEEAERRVNQLAEKKGKHRR